MLASKSPLLRPRPERRAAPGQPSLLDLPNVLLVSQGRAAITLALRHKNIGPGDTVLMPAFHCPAMSAAIRAAGATPVFFPITESLVFEPDRIFKAADTRTRAILVPHLFVVRQPESVFRSLRENSSWLIVEDCAHCFFGFRGQRAVGVDGDYAIGSIAKFFPGGWGGVLASSTELLPAGLTDPALRFDIKLALNALEQTAQFGRLGTLSRPAAGVLATISRLRRRGRRLVRCAPSQASLTQSPGVDEPVAEEFRERTSGRWIRSVVGATDRFAARAAARLQNFAKLRGALSHIGSAKLPISDAGPDFPPYVLPLLLSEPEWQFAELRRRGVPMYRWDSCPAGNCEVTDWFRRSLIQLPCHETLDDLEIEAMARELTSVLA